MPYTIDPDLEYFLGISLPAQETSLLSDLRKDIEQRDLLSSPPHITVKPPFTYYFEKPLTEQLAKWAKRQRAFPIVFEKVASFKHRQSATVFLSPEKGKPFRQLEQDLSDSIRFLPEEANYTPHLTVASKITYQDLETTKEKIRAMRLSLEFMIDNITLFEHRRFEPWRVKEVYYFGKRP